MKMVQHQSNGSGVLKYRVVSTQQAWLEACVVSPDAEKDMTFNPQAD